MKILLRMFIIIGFTSLLGACTIPYQIAGRFEDTGQAFRGNVLVSPFDIGSIEVQTDDGSVICEGTSKVTKRPSYYSKIGGQGMAFAECNDGRTFKIDFIQTTETGGHGLGLDDQGNVVKVYFDQSAAVVNSRMEIDLLNSLTQ